MRKFFQLAGICVLIIAVSLVTIYFVWPKPQKTFEIVSSSPELSFAIKNLAFTPDGLQVILYNNGKIDAEIYSYTCFGHPNEESAIGKILIQKSVSLNVPINEQTPPALIFPSETYRIIFWFRAGQEAGYIIIEH